MSTPRCYTDQTMPTYEYACTKCHRRFEAVQSPARGTEDQHRGQDGAHDEHARRDEREGGCKTAEEEAKRRSRRQRDAKSD